MSSNPGAALAAMRPDRQVTCAHCGAAFTAKDSRAKFCGNACKQADAYARGKKYRRKTPAPPPD